MSVTEFEWRWMDGWPPGHSTVQVNFAPATMEAQTGPQGRLVDKANHTKIIHYRRRLSDGSDIDVDFDDRPSWPPVIHDHISSITFATAIGDEDEPYLYAHLDCWGPTQ